jgi:hypothetical protein
MTSPGIRGHSRDSREPSSINPKKKPRTIRARLKRAEGSTPYFLAAILPEPPHFVQLLPAFAASTQHA